MQFILIFLAFNHYGGDETYSRDEDVYYHMHKFDIQRSKKKISSYTEISSLSRTWNNSLVTLVRDLWEKLLYEDEKKSLF